MKSLTEERYKEVLSAIGKYSEVYSTFEKYQKEDTGSDPLLPKHGDQKTGIIGEFYAMLFLRHQGKKNISYAAHGSPYDLSFEESGKIIKVQVKTVLSGFSKTNTMSPLKSGWDYLYLISLDKNFMPNGFWINSYNSSLFKNRKIIQSARIKNPESNNKGSSCFNFNDNRKEELQKVIENYK